MGEGGVWWGVGGRLTALPGTADSRGWLSAQHGHTQDSPPNTQLPIRAGPSVTRPLSSCPVPLPHLPWEGVGTPRPHGSAYSSTRGEAASVVCVARLKTTQRESLESVDFAISLYTPVQFCAPIFASRWQYNFSAHTPPPGGRTSVVAGRAPGA